MWFPTGDWLLAGPFPEQTQASLSLCAAGTATAHPSPHLGPSQHRNQLRRRENHYLLVGLLHREEMLCTDPLVTPPLTVGGREGREEGPLPHTMIRSWGSGGMQSVGLWNRQDQARGQERSEDPAGLACILGS